MTNQGIRIGQFVRQGDVLLRRVEVLPAGAARVDTGGRAIVVEYGEVTGHAHVIDRGAELYNVVSEAGEVVGQYLAVLEHTELAHDEHGPLPLAPGVYERWYQVEDDGTEERRVLD